MYSIVKFSGCDAVLERNTVGFFGKFSFLEDFFRILQIPPPLQKTKKRDKRGVFVAKGRDSEWVEYFDWIEYFDWVKYSEWIEYSEWVEYSDWIRGRGRVKNLKSGRAGRAEKVRKKLDRAGPDLRTE